MIDLGNIAHVKNRILEIQQKIGMLEQQAAPVDFESQFQKALGAQGTQNTKQAAPTAASMQTPAKKTNAAAVSSAKLPYGVGTGLTPSVSNLPAANGELSSYISSAAQKYNVDPRLISAVVEAESGGDQSAVSSVGAIGVMQLMPSTAASLGVNPYDEAQNVEGGTKYLRQLLDRFGGDVRKAVAAYNAGPAAVEAYGGVPPYAETQNYVDKVLDLYR